MRPRPTATARWRPRRRRAPCGWALIANLADAWATYAADRDLLAIAQDTAANARESVRLTRARLDGGVAPRTDLRQAEQILATAEDAIAEQTSALAQDENLIRLLVGGDVDRALLPGGLADVTPAIASLPAGVNSQRRLDVHQTGDNLVTRR